MRSILLHALRQLANDIDGDELVYLTLTSKPEFLVRDKLAWALTGAQHLVAREWHDRDLVVFADNVPSAIVELKAAHTGSVEWGRARTVTVRGAFAEQHGASTYLEGLIRADVQKALRDGGTQCSVYAAVILYHVLDPVPPQLDRYVKYGKELRAVANRKLAEEKIRSYLDRLGRSTRVRLGGGSAFGIRCCVDVWLCGPVGDLA